jgi:hypothetical protein
VAGAVMKPVQIKYLGLFWTTKRCYLIENSIAVLVGGSFVALAAACGLLPRLDWPTYQELYLPDDGFLPWFFNNEDWILLGLLLIGIADTCIVLRIFARKEAEQRARLGNAESSTTID